MNRLRRSSINVLASVAGYAVPMVINFATTPLLLCALGEAAYGLQSLVAVIIGYLTVMDMGLDLPIIKYLAEDHARNDTEVENRLLSTTLQMYGTVGLVGMSVIMLSADLLAQRVFKVPDDLVSSAVQVFRLAGIGFLGSVGLSWGRAVTMGLQRFDITYGVSVVTNVAGVGLGLGMVYAGHGVTGYVLMRVITSLLAGVAYWLLAGRLLPTFRVRWGLDWMTLRRVSGYVGYGAVNRIIGSLVGRLDQTLIGIWLGVAAAGIYAVPFMIVNSLAYMIAYMLGFIFPMASELHSLGQVERLRDIFTRATRFMTALANMIFVPLLMLGDRFLALWVGPHVAGQAAGVFCLLSLSAYLGVLTTSLTNSVLIGIGRMRQFTLYAMIRGLVLGAGCVLLIRPFGLEGAGMALLLTEVVDVVYLIIALRRYLRISPATLLRVAYLRPIMLGLALAVLALIARPWADTWIGLILIVGALELPYIIVGYWIGVFGETEKRVLREIQQVLRRSLVRTKAV